MLSNVIQCQVLLFCCVLPGHVNGKMNLNKEKKKKKASLEERREAIKIIENGTVKSGPKPLMFSWKIIT